MSPKKRQALVRRAMAAHRKKIRVAVKSAVEELAREPFNPIIAAPMADADVSFAKSAEELGAREQPELEERKARAVVPWVLTANASLGPCRCERPVTAIRCNRSEYCGRCGCEFEVRS